MIAQMNVNEARRRRMFDMTDMRMETARTTLRPARLADVDNILVGLSNFDVARMLEGASLPLMRQDALELFEALPQDGEGGWTFALTLKDDQAVGLISLTGSHDAYLLQYWLDRAHWGQGLMGEALDGLINDLFHEFPQAKVQADVYADDVPALHLQQRLGFKTIGCRNTFVSIRSAMVLKIEMRMTKTCFLAKTNLRQ